MRILKISQEAPSFEANTYGLLRKAIQEGRVEWQLLQRQLPDNALYRFGYAGFIKPTLEHVISNQVHSVILQVNVSKENDGNIILSFDVLLNQKRSLNIADHVKIKSMSKVVPLKDLNKVLTDILSSEFSITNLPSLSASSELPPTTRLTRMKNRLHPATEIIISSERPRLMSDYAIWFNINNMETGITSEGKKMPDVTSKEDAIRVLDDLIKRVKARGYVDKTSMDYIPEGSNKDNFDFDINQPKTKEVAKDVSEPATPKIVRMPGHKGLYAKNKQLLKTSQDYEGYFSGNIPDSAASMLGTPSVDASQIKSMFGKADEAIKLVNQFDRSLLSPVSFIFNFGKSGAYGVYLSALDRAIKTKALQKQLESRGYKIDSQGELLTAYPTKEEKNSDEIQADIDNLYREIESKGSTAFGINMNAILNSSKEDAYSMNSPDPNVWEWIAILHLGSTITHEAIHAKGAMDEGPAEAGASQFLNFALPIVNREYEASLKSQKKDDMFSPLIISTTTKHAQKKSWYRKAQSYVAMPKSVMDMPFGSDLSGRFPTGAMTDAGLAMWNLVSQQSSTAPIESKLGRQYVFPIYPDIDVSKDSIEEQLRKSTKYTKRIDPRSSMEEVLTEGHDPNRGYLTIEQLLDEKRVKPLIVPLKKNASVVKIATLFGWMNNLQISDGSTIPGLGDRVMAWEDRDEDFAEDEKWIRKQPRYNPEYDIKGFYYRWIEPRFKPQLFDDMNRDYSGTSPAKRFASHDSDIDKILSVFSEAKQKILNREISGTRFIMTEDVLKLVEKVFDSCKCQISIFQSQSSKEDIYSVWIYAPSVSEQDIERIERHFQKKDDSEQDIIGLIERVTGISAQKESVIESILKQVEEICRGYDVERIAFDKDLQVLDNGTIVLNFSNLGKDVFLKIGSLLSEVLGAKDPYIEADRIVFVYKGYQVSITNNKEGDT